MPEDAIIESLEADLAFFMNQADYFMNLSKSCPPFEAVRMRRESDKWSKAAEECKRSIADRRAQLGIKQQ